jgi:hypothetical protein
MSPHDKLEAIGWLVYFIAQPIVMVWIFIGEWLHERRSR